MAASVADSEAACRSGKLRNRRVELTGYGAQLLGQRMRDLLGTPRIGEPIAQEVEGAGPVQDIADQQQAGVAALVVLARCGV